MPTLTARATDEQAAAFAKLAKSRKLSVSGLILSILDDPKPGKPAASPKAEAKELLAGMTIEEVRALVDENLELKRRLAARPAGPTNFGRPAPADVPEVYLVPQAEADRRSRQQRIDQALQKAFPQRARRSS